MEYRHNLHITTVKLVDDSILTDDDFAEFCIVAFRNSAA